MRVEDLDGFRDWSGAFRLVGGISTGREELLSLDRSGSEVRQECLTSTVGGSF